MKATDWQILARRITSMFVIMFVVAITFGLSLPRLFTALAVAPSNIVTYQGRVLNANGVPVADATADMVFELYDSLAGGTCLWSNSSSTCASATARTVTLTDGLFSENLGDTTVGVPYAAIPDTVFADNASVYLQVTIETEILAPRKRLTAAPFAVNAQTLDGVDSGDFLLNTGDTAAGTYDFTGVTFAGASPFNFEGATVDAAVTTFTVTDPTLDRTITFKDESGTVAYMSDISGGGLFTDGGATTYLTATGDNFAIGGSGITTSPFAVDVAGGTGVYIGDGSTFNGTLVFKASDADTGSLTYTTLDAFSFSGGNVEIAQDLTVTQDVAINGGDITSTATTFNFDIGDTGTWILRDGTNNLLTVTDAGTVGNVNVTGDLAVTGDNIDSAGAPLVLNFTEADEVRVGTGTPTVAIGAGDFYITDALEVDGAIDVGSTITATDFICTDCLDFTDFSDTMSLDASTTVTHGTSDLTFNLGTSGSGGSLIVRNNSSSFFTFNDNQTLFFATDATTSNAFSIFADLTTGSAIDMVLNSLTSGNALAVISSTLTSGSVVDATITSAFSGNLIDLQATGAATGDFIDITSTSATATARAINIDLDNGNNNNDVFVLTSDETTSSGTAADTVKARISASGEFFSDVGFTAGGASTRFYDGSITVTSGDLALSISGGDLTFGQATVLGDGGDQITLNSSGTLTIDDAAIAGSGAFAVNSAAASILTLDSGTTGTVNLATSNDAKILNIATGTAANTVNIGTDATAGDTIVVGNSHISTVMTLTGGDDWNMANTGVLTLSASAAQATAIVATDTDYTNAISVGDNNVLGTTANIDFDNFDVVGSTGNITTAGDIAVNGDDITSDGTLTIDSSGTIRLGADDDLIPQLDIGSADLGSSGAAWDNVFVLNTDDATMVSLSANGVDQTTSGASVIGTCTVACAFTQSTGGNVQDVLKEFDTAINGLAAGSSKWTDAGTFTYLTAATDDLVAGGITVSAASLFFDQSAANLYLGTNESLTDDTGEAVLTFYSSGVAVADASLTTNSTGDLINTLGVGTNLLNVLTGNLKVGNGVPSVALDGEDIYIEGTFEADGAARFDGAVTMNSTLNSGATTVSSLTVGAIGLADITSNPASGAALVGTFDEFTQSAGTNVQDVLFDFDTAINGLAAGSSKWTDAGTFTYLTNTSDDLVIGSTTIAAASLYFDEDTAQLDLGTTDLLDGKLRLYSSGVGAVDPTFAANSAGAVALTADGFDYTTAQSTTNGINILGDSLTSGDVFNVSADALTSGSLIDMTASSAFSGNLINFVATAASTGDFFSVQSNSATSTSMVLDMNLDNGDVNNTVFRLISDETTNSGTAADTLKASLTASGEFTSDYGFSAGFSSYRSDSITTIGGGPFDFLDGGNVAIDIGGVNTAGINTINIATEGSSLDTITIGNTNVGTTLALTGGDDWDITGAGVLTLSASAAATTAILATDTDYTNALSVGDNNILGTTANLDFNNFDVVGSTGNITTAGDLAVNGDDITSDGNLTLDASSTVQLGTDDLFLTTGNITHTFVGNESLNITGTYTDDQQMIIASATLSDDADATDDLYGFDLAMNPESGDAGDTTTGMRIRSSSTADDTVDAYITLFNADTTAAVTDGIFYQSNGGTITDAIDATDSFIVNALNFGANNIIGTTGNIDMSAFDVVGSSGNITTAGDIAVNGGDVSTTAVNLNFTVADTGVFLFRDGTNSLITITDAGTTGNITVTGDADIDGGDLTSNSSTFNFLDGFGDSTRIDIGGVDTAIGNTINIATELTADVITIGNSTAATTMALTGGNDWSINAAGTGTFTDLSCTDCLDFTEFADALALDTSTSIAMDGSETFTISNGSTANALVNLTSTGDYAIQDAGTTFFTFNDDRSVDYTTNQSTTNGFDFTLSALTTGVGFNLASTATLQTTGDLFAADHTATYTSATTVSGQIHQLSRALTNNSAGTLTVSGDILTISSSNANVSGTLTDTANLLSLNQTNTGATGALLDIDNSGTGSSIFVDPAGNTGTTVSSTLGGAVHIENSNNDNYGLTVYSNNGSTSSDLAYFFNDNILFDNDVVAITNDSGTTGSTGLIVRQSIIDDFSGGSDGSLQGLIVGTNEAANTDELVVFLSDIDGTPDDEFRFQNDGNAFADGTWSGSGADFAEYFDSNDTTIAVGEVVCVDPAMDNGVKRCEAGNSNLVGVVSDTPGFVGNYQEAFDNGVPANYHVVGLTGQITTKASADDGAIGVGDLVTISSTTAGAVGKATGVARVLGYALEAQPSGTGTIKVLVEPHWSAEGILNAAGNATQVTTDMALVSGAASSGAPAVDSPELTLRGAAWTGAASANRAMTVQADVNTADDYRLSIKNNDGTEVAYVNDDGDMAIAGRLYPSDRGTLQTTKYIYYDGTVGMGGDMMRTNASGWSTGSYDFAEMFPSAQSLSPGEVVIFGDDNESVLRSTGVAYDQKIAGIISTRPGFLAGENKAGDVPVALAGRVPTYVSGENGSIAIGDPLTTSTKPGYAMKATDAGQIVGYAMENFAGDTGSIIVFVRSGHYDGGPVPEAPAAENVASGMQSVSALDVTGTLNMNGGRIISIGAMAGIGDRWYLEEDGDFFTRGRIATIIHSTQNEDVSTYAVTSSQTAIQLMGTSVLQAGEARVDFEAFDPTFNDIISIDTTYRVFLTPSSPTGQLYAIDRGVGGFTIRENGSSDGVTIDWLVIAYHKDFAPTVAAPAPTDPIPAEEVAPLTSDGSGTIDFSEPIVTPPVDESTSVVEPVTDPVIDETPVTDPTPAVEPTSAPADVPLTDPTTTEVLPADSTSSTDTTTTEPAPADITTTTAPADTTTTP